MQILTDDHAMIIDAVRTALGRLREQDYSWNAPGDPARLFAKVRAAFDELGLLGPCDRDSTAATSLTQSLIAIEAGRAMIPFPAIEALLWTWLSARLDTTAENVGTVTLSCDTKSTLPIHGGHATGTLRQIPFADMASHILAFTDSSSPTEADIVLLPVAGAKLRSIGSVDSTYRLFEADIDAAVGQHVFRFADAADRKRAELHRALLAAAEMTGIGLKMIDMTVDYLKTRVQFGKALGANQVLKHVMADDYVHMEALRSMIFYAAAALDADAPEAAELVWGAKHFAGRTGHELGNHMLQAHGAIGYTTELELQRYLRRLFSLTAFHVSTYDSGEALFDVFAHG